MHIQEHIKRFNELISLQKFDEKSLDYSQLDKHISFLKQLAIVENSSLSIFDLNKKKYVFIHSKLLPLIGLSDKEMLEGGPQLFYSLIHPEDVPILIEAYYLFIDFISRLEFENRKRIKLMCDFRMKDRNGEYKRFLNQLVPLELDSRGNIWLMLILYDLYIGKDLFSVAQRKMFDLQTNEIIFFEKDIGKNKEPLLTKREKEVLRLMAKGMPSKKIADELFLSINTVNNHRRKILEKTKTENTAMAIQYGMSFGIL